MQQLFEFANNHLILVMAFAMVLGMIVFTEYTRMASGATTLTPIAATQLLNDGNAVFVDVRDDAEFRKGHVLDAKNIPVRNLDSRIQELVKHKDKDIVVYCDSGMRSSKAIRTLKKNGFDKTYNLAGGLVAWQKASLPVVT
ncbi:MAG: rhodanese-like domain-containing protein [Gammaproteobacteria bacterium]|nr:rhodanese-like domain-containing protein [Gammaproteobacteria bacterium]